MFLLFYNPKILPRSTRLLLEPSSSCNIIRTLQTINSGFPVVCELLNRITYFITESHYTSCVTGTTAWLNYVEFLAIYLIVPGLGSGDYYNLPWKEQPSIFRACCVQCSVRINS